jgi:hypothetical protein
VNFPFISNNIPAAPAYGVYISQLIGYSRACGSYQDFLDRGWLLTRKLLNHGFLLVKLKSSLRKFYGHHHDLADRYGISVSQMTTCTDMFHLSTIFKELREFLSVFSSVFHSLIGVEEFEDTKGVIRMRISKRNGQHNGKKKKYKRTNNDLQNMHIKLKIE